MASYNGLLKNVREIHKKISKCPLKLSSARLSVNDYQPASASTAQISQYLKTASARPVANHLKLLSAIEIQQTFGLRPGTIKSRF